MEGRLPPDGDDLFEWTDSPARAPREEGAAEEERPGTGEREGVERGAGERGRPRGARAPASGAGGAPIPASGAPSAATPASSSGAAAGRRLGGAPAAMICPRGFAAARTRS